MTLLYINADNDNSRTLSVEDMYLRLTIFTAISSNHFIEAQDMLSSFSKCFPEKKIILFDLGLTEAQRTNLSQRSYLDFRPFPFEEYKNVPYLKNLFMYGWKPLITQKISLESDVIMYSDASVRMISCNIRPALEHLLKFPIFPGNPAQHYKAIEFTHDGMMKYLEFPKTRKSIADVPTFQTGVWLILVNGDSRKKIIEPWVDCALHKECMAPEGSQRKPCNMTKKHDGHYIGCHRYDQSAINLILAREYGPNFFSRGSVPSISKKLFIIQRRRRS